MNRDFGTVDWPSCLISETCKCDKEEKRRGEGAIISPQGRDQTRAFIPTPINHQTGYTGFSLATAHPMICSNCVSNRGVCGDVEMVPELVLPLTWSGAAKDA